MATTPNVPKTNRLGLAVLDYRGSKTTLCAGCGHNAISERIIDAMYEMGVQPERVAKLSGIVGAPVGGVDGEGAEAGSRGRYDGTLGIPKAYHQ